jgi:ABC-type glycerol-3-phosphate transport system substrate-binding protein
MDGKRVARAAAAILVVAALAAVVAGLASAKKSGGTANKAVSGKITFFGIWSADEQTAFEKVIAGFNKKFPNVTVDYQSKGNDVPTVLATAIAAGHPPDMADVAQPGLVKQLAKQGHLKPITFAKSAIKANFKPVWLSLGSVSGKPYALVFKASNKSTLWYNVPAFKQAGIKAPKTWSALLKDAKTLKASGTPAYSLCGASGWTLTDIFENIYLRTYGPAKYNQLSAHRIKWTDKTVTKAMQEMKQIIGDSSNLAGGRSSALQTDYPTCVDHAFATPSKGSMVLQGDFVANEILQATKAKPGSGFNAVPFPAIKKGPNSTAVEIGGDLIIAFHSNPAIKAFVNYLASASAAKIWAHLGGFGTGNKNMPTTVYPDKITRSTETPLSKAKSVVFDMSDEQPASFGATTGQGEWGLFQKLLENPGSYKNIQKQLESAAKKAYK